MRLARSLLVLALSGAVAHADDARPANAPADKTVEAHTKVPLRIVRMLPETRQVLLFDKTKGTHVVVEVGQAVEGFLVDSIDADELTLVSEDGVLVVLAAPEPAWRHHRDDRHPTDGGNGRESRGLRTADATSRTADAATTTAATPGEPQPADPYADVAEPSTIGTGADGVRVVEAPGAAPTSDVPSSAQVTNGGPSTIGTGADGVRVVEAPGGPATAPAAATASFAATTPPAATVPAAATAPAAAAVIASGAAPAAAADPTGDALAAALTGAPVVSTTGPSTAVAPATSPPAGLAAAASDGPIVLARGDVATALSNFGTLAGSIKGAFTPAGVRVDGVAAGSLFAKAGLRGGDVIASVDGVPLRSLDAAADLYARAATARNVSVALVRAGKPVMLRVAIQ